MVLSNTPSKGSVPSTPMINGALFAGKTSGGQSMNLLKLYKYAAFIWYSEGKASSARASGNPVAPATIKLSDATAICLNVMCFVAARGTVDVRANADAGRVKIAM